MQNSKREAAQESGNIRASTTDARKIWVWKRTANSKGNVTNVANEAIRHRIVKKQNRISRSIKTAEDLRRHSMVIVSIATRKDIDRMSAQRREMATIMMSDFIVLQNPGLNLDLCIVT